MVVVVVVVVGLCCSASDIIIVQVEAAVVPVCHVEGACLDCHCSSSSCMLFFLWGLQLCVLVTVDVTVIDNDAMAKGGKAAFLKKRCIVGIAMSIAPSPSRISGFVIITITSSSSSSSSSSSMSIMMEEDGLIEEQEGGCAHH